MATIKFLDLNGLSLVLHKLNAYFVKKEAGKGLTSNDYTTDEKNKLAGIAAGATANTGTITGIKMNGASKGTSGVVDLGTVITDVSGKVDKVSGKGLSTNDYTTAEKNKLAGIAAGATANTGTITGIKMNGASKGTSGTVDLGTVVTDAEYKEVETSGVKEMRLVISKGTSDPLSVSAKKIATDAGSITDLKPNTGDDAGAPQLTAVLADGSTKTLSISCSDIVTQGQGIAAITTDNSQLYYTKGINTTKHSIITFANLKSKLGLTKSDVGLGNVDNTSDANKPISTATQNALNTINSRIDTLVGGESASGVIDTFNEMKTFLADYSATDSTLKSVIDSLANTYLKPSQVVALTETEVNSALTDAGITTA